MSWKQQLFKPRWQHKNPEYRSEAVARLNDPDLLAALPEICLHDDDAGVRRAAAQRLHQPEALLTALNNEPDPQTKEAISKRLQFLMTSDADDRPHLAERQSIVNATSDRDLLEAVASKAPESELRMQALSRIERQGFLGDRAVHDPDPATRRVAAQAIHQHSTLRRVLDEVRKTDKALFQDLSVRLHAELLAAGDAQAIEEEAMVLCQLLESHALEKPGKKMPSGSHSRWQAIAAQVPEALQQRHERVVARIQQAWHEAQQPKATPAPVEPVAAIEAPAEAVAAVEAAETAEDEPDRDSEQDAAALNDLAKEIAQTQHPARVLAKLEKQLHTLMARWSAPEATVQAAFDAARAALKQQHERIEEQHQAKAAQLEQGLAQARQLLEQFATQLEDGALQKALSTRKAFEELATRYKGQRAWVELNKELNQLHGRLRELRDWQHWSNDKVRKELINEMEILPQAGLHPDAMLDRLKALQKQWKDLETSEQIPGDQHFAAAPWMWNKFRSAGQKAFKAAEPFLNKRSEILDAHLKEKQETAAQLAAAAAEESPDWAALGRCMSKAREAMRSLDEVPPRARGKMAATLKQALEQGNQAMQRNYDAVEKAKRKLIRAAESLTFQEDKEQAISEAKRLQAEWKTAGRSYRKLDNELWDAFRAPLDPLFDGLKAEQTSQREAQQAERQAQQALVDELQKILKSADHELADESGKVQGLSDSWRDVQHPDRGIQARFEALNQQFDQRIKAHKNQQGEIRRQLWWQKARLLHDLEWAVHKGKTSAAATTKLIKNWPETAQPTELDAALDQRWQAAQQPEATVVLEAENRAAAAHLCIQLEFLAGLPSPDAEKAQRMQYQVERLSRSLSGEGQQRSALEKAREAEQEWLRMELLDSKDYTTFEGRIKAALEQIYGSL